MTRTKQLSCRKHRCDAPPHLGGQEALDALNKSEWCISLAKEIVAAA